MTSGVACPVAHTAGGHQRDLQSHGGRRSLATALPPHSRPPPAPSRALCPHLPGHSWGLDLELTVGPKGPHPELGESGKPGLAWVWGLRWGRGEISCHLLSLSTPTSGWELGSCLSVILCFSPLGDRETR